MNNGWQFALGIIILLIGIVGGIALAVYGGLLPPMLVGLLYVLALAICVCGVGIMVCGTGF